MLSAIFHHGADNEEFSFSLAIAAITCTMAEAQQLNPIELTGAQRAIAQRGVLDALKDPGSAQFGLMRAGVDPSTNAVSVCGMVNAKNSFGGFTGMRAYVGLISANGFIVAAMEQDDSGSVRTVCRARGLAI